MRAITGPEDVTTREDLAAFVSLLLEDCEANADEWQNSDLPSFLEAMAAWIQDMDRYYDAERLDMEKLTPWRLIADILEASRIYEA